MTLVRVPTVLDVSTINVEWAGELACRIHPLDLAELRASREFCWPDNAPRDVFCGVKLIEDADASTTTWRRVVVLSLIHI